MTAAPVPQQLDRRHALEMVRVTERAAVAAAVWRGRGDEQSAEEAATSAAYAELGQMSVSGRVVIGAGVEGDVSHLYIGETVGGGGDAVDIAADALEGATLCAKNMPGSMAVMVLAAPGSLLQVPPVYMDKVAIGPGYPKDVISLRVKPEDNIRALAEAKGVSTSDITALVLDRPRHAGLIAAVRAIGASVKLITDGDVAGVIHTTNPRDSGVDIYLGTGGAAEGVLAAAALRCMGGQMQGRLILDTDDKRGLARKLGIRDPGRIYDLSDMVAGDCLMAATGVTDGPLLHGVRFSRGLVETDTLLMRAASGTVRRISTRHSDPRKFGLEG
ncbi:fructose-1,6-bisphosphatase [Azorhizobium oxalatiphilum]|uniref:Fructose-1,6-bisphosphatase n=1 Tax=Azorhizobium oxalatiphilum TaxID=980631 RepID=A0A917F849_9HYPH|nr:class II fructose-bisphosphatase [Azorhizobium oxalatiphilum]GGF55825.1 fructose-1,6-bisphosphatase [Azorhizobium oxalatiphilum]